MQCDARVGSIPRRGEAAPRACIARGPGAALLLGVLLCPRVAAAADADVRTTAANCEEYDLERLGELLAIEIGTIRSEHASRPSDLFLECRSGAVSVRVALRSGAAERSGVVNPGAADRATRTRLLALTTSELLAQLWSDTSGKPPADAPAPATTPIGPERAPPGSQATEHVIASVGGAFRSLLGPGASLFGATLGADYRFSSLLVLGLDVEGVFGSVQSKQADVGVSLGSASAHALAERRFGSVTVGAGVGARLGLAWFRPTNLAPTAVGHDIMGPWAGPLALARIRWRAARGFVISSTLEAGLFTLPFAGTLNGETAVLDLHGAWLAASVGAGTVF